MGNGCFDTLTCTYGSLRTLPPSSRVADVRGEIVAIYISLKAGSANRLRQKASKKLASVAPEVKIELTSVTFFFLSIDYMPTEAQSGQKLMQNINFLKVMPKYTVKTAEFGQKYQMNDSQNEREVTNLHRKCKNQKTKKISRSGIQIRKN